MRSLRFQRGLICDLVLTWAGADTLPGVAAPAASYPAWFKEASVAAPPSFRAGKTALVRIIARPAGVQLPFPVFDDRSFPDEGQAETASSRLAWVRALWADPELAEAVRHASPVLAAQTDTLCSAAAPSGRDVRRVGVSLARYLLRAGHRATPFGLFAGVVTAAFGPQTGAVWGQEHVVVARAGAEWLAGVVEQLEKSGELLPLLSVVVNDTAFERDGRLIVPFQDEGVPGRRRAVEASVELTAPVRTVLGTAGVPVRFGELAEKLSAEFESVLPDRVHGLLAGLIRRRVLITNLQAPATETDALGHVLAQLDMAGTDSLAPLAQTLRKLHTIRSRLERCDSPGSREAVAGRMRELVPGLRRHPLALDLRVDADVVLPEAVAREVERAATVLTRLSARPYGTRAWGEYHQRFYERYGVGTMVPLLEAVADSGVGYPDGYPGAPAGTRRHRVSHRDEVLVRLAQAAALDSQDEVVLTDAMVAALDVGPEEPRVPPHLEVGVRLHAASVQEARRGRFTVEVASVSRGAGVATGRFLSVLGPAEREALSVELAALPTADAETVPAQLSFPPLLPDTAHVTRAPRVLPLVISLQEHRAPSASVLTPADLAVACDGRRMYLAAPGLGKRVEAVGLHALNLTAHTPPLARFLTEVSRAQCAQVTAFDWGVAAAMPFLPRLRYGRIVLAPARWRLEAADLPGPDRPGTEWDIALSGWRERRRLPRHVHLVQDDRRLPLDLDRSAHRSLVRQHLDRFGYAVLTEGAPPEANGWSGGRGHEIVVPLKAVQPPPQSRRCPSRQPPADSPGPRRRPRPPPRCCWPPCTGTCAARTPYSSGTCPTSSASSAPHRGGTSVSGTLTSTFVCASRWRTRTTSPTGSAQ